MATNVGDSYVTEEEYLAVTRGGTRNPVQDSFLMEDLKAASRVVDSKLERNFTLLNEERVAGNDAFTTLALPDLAKVTTVWQSKERDGGFVEVSSANYSLIREDFDQEAPYTAIQFRQVYEWVRIDGSWGWLDAPSPVKRATILIAQRARLELPSAEYTDDRFSTRGRTLDLVETIITTYCEAYRRKPSPYTELDWFKV